MSSVRVRFAPSPTGNLHVGGARTALFNWLFARKNNGKFLLRIEDTDKERSKNEYVEDIMESLCFLGLEWDEQPVFQSKRVKNHREIALRLLREGKAYRCFCPSEKLEEERKWMTAENRAYKYSGYCRNLMEELVQQKMREHLPFALRFKIEADSVNWKDGVHGEIKVAGAEIEDFIILRSDGNPTYMLSVVVDDIDMGVTDVIRGDDHISNTPKQILLHSALGKKPPNYSHVPLILGKDKKRLSKRHGAVSVLEYRRMGILGAALRNYLALLGWSPGDNREVMSLEELIGAFSLQEISNKSAVFDFDKLEWMNGKYLSLMADESLAFEAFEWWKNYGRKSSFEVENNDYFKHVIGLAKARMKRISDIFERDKYYFQDPLNFDEEGVKKHLKLEGLQEKLQALNQDFSTLSEWKAEALEKVVRMRAKEWGISGAKLIHPLRLLLTGGTVSPGLFELMEVLGPETVIRRIKNYILLLLMLIKN